MIVRNLTPAQTRIPLAAVIFDPWPFHEENVLTTATLLMGSDGKFEECYPLQTLDKNSWNALLYLSTGELAVTMAEYVERYYPSDAPAI